MENQGLREALEAQEEQLGGMSAVVAQEVSDDDAIMVRHVWAPHVGACNARCAGGCVSGSLSTATVVEDYFSHPAVESS